MQYPGQAVVYQLAGDGRHQLFFRVDLLKQVVQVLAVWGAPRGSGPKL